MRQAVFLFEAKEGTKKPFRRSSRAPKRVPPAPRRPAGRARPHYQNPITAKKSYNGLMKRLNPGVEIIQGIKVVYISQSIGLA